MDDKNTTETTTTTDSTVKAADTKLTTASAPAADSKPAVSSVTAGQPDKAVATPTAMGGGETKTMAETTTKKIDPKFEGCEAYVVQKGDALVDIANKYKVGLNQLRYFNGVPKATFKISEGQTIYIPKGEVKVPVGA